MLEFAIIKDKNVEVTIDPNEFVDMVMVTVDRKISKALEDKGRFSSKKLNETEVLGIVKQSVTSCVDTLERILKVRRKP